MRRHRLRVALHCLFATVNLSLLHPTSSTYALTISSYNVENLWDHHPQPPLPPDFPPERAKFVYPDYSARFSNWISQRSFQHKARHLLTALRIADLPDIVGLQELENSADLKEIWKMPVQGRTTLGQSLHRLGYQTLLLGPQNEETPTSVTTAFIAKFPVKALPSITIDLPRDPRSARDIQVVELNHKGQRVLLYNAHFKSRRQKHSDAIRTLCATAMWEHYTQALAQDPDLQVVMLGDFNAFIFEPAFQALHQTHNKQDMIDPKQNRLYNLWFELPVEKRWETSFNGSYQHLSHMLVSKGFFHHQGLIYQQGSFRVVGQGSGAEEMLLDADHTPFRWQAFKERRYTRHIGQGYSDHLPLVARFEDSPEEETLPHPVELTPPIEGVLQQHAEVGFPIPEACTEENTIDISHYSESRALRLLGQCVKITVPAPTPALQLKTRGRYRSNFIHLPISSAHGFPLKKKIRKSKHHPRCNKWTLGISMFSPFNWRPNYLDPRVPMPFPPLQEGTYSPRHPHP
ncbi:MAG: hypothetical protein OXT67_13370, partial [Zetaproteobacteria bacterium]|nr:hypothetical protein [Zetaproteobacteria bacterium]